MSYKYGGVSLIGSNGINQDYYANNVFDWGMVIVVADGLGSKAHSAIGAKAVCESVICLAEKYRGRVDDSIVFFRGIHEDWMDKLGDYYANDCSTTCLLCIINNDTVFAARLGDGFIGLVTDTDEFVLFDEDTDHFANETDCLHDCFQPDAWKHMTHKVENCDAVILTTDGIGVGDGSKSIIAEFCRDFYLGYKNVKIGEIEEDIRIWLSDWYGGDDKTIAFIIREIKNENENTNRQ